MNRRNFLSLLGLSVGAVALNEAIPFGRVYSFPSNIVIARSFADSKMFARIDEAVGAMMIRRTIYESRDFYGPNPIPLRVEMHRMSGPRTLDMTPEQLGNIWCRPFSDYDAITITD